MQELESVRNEIPTYVIDRLENEWRVMQTRNVQLETGLRTETPANTAPATGDSRGSLDK
ncbi:MULTISPECIES: hypothetical protein [Rhizobium]|uniref:hypothetical protein n=1 Tax=Rhizobium TaxID=379 RepID=UPI00119B91C9|nr:MULTISPECIES: hypothetical protein [Rhizobium]TWB14451.1 hypothetical protein FBZ99_104204 [Rhizobium sp. ERR1071]TWB57854.1 hypothetical protein FBZ98_102479 [Rhizobium sp. ERR 922]QYA15330.1 hypothetical protein J5284_20180 [Rhizobium sp. AB2/73]TWB99549.1 hypothetical protein FBZ97_102479 [Rhizobium sp. ERR 942]UEQ83802.1 hypothetical protein I8E17_20830 [Rhizobium sp. AB2/73]